jgi:hypothetical protein
MSDQRHAEQIIQLWDEALTGLKEGQAYADTRASIVPAVIELTANDERDPIAEAEALIDAVMDRVRRHRRETLKEQVEYVLDSLFMSGEDGAHIDPLLDVGYGLGSAKGDDKLLRLWTREDFRNLMLTAYRNAGDVMAAAVALDAVLQRLIEVMEAQDAETVGDLHSGEAAS